MEIAVEVRDIIFKWVGIWWLANRLTDVVRYARGCWTARRADREVYYDDAECEPVTAAAEDSGEEDTVSVSAWEEEEE